ncbi:hypothetical protein T439DRAFT_93900 [Meredithblackwellia eburnea MCA 4105]
MDVWNVIPCTSCRRLKRRCEPKEVQGGGRASFPCVYCQYRQIKCVGGELYPATNTWKRRRKPGTLTEPFRGSSAVGDKALARSIGSVSKFSTRSRLAEGQLSIAFKYQITQETKHLAEEDLKANSFSFNASFLASVGKRALIFRETLENLAVNRPSVTTTGSDGFREVQMNMSMFVGVRRSRHSECIRQLR